MEALSYLEKSLRKQEQAIDYVLKDEDWVNYLQDKDFLKLIDRYR